MDADRLREGLAMRQAQHDARDALDQAAEAYGRFLDSLTQGELESFLQAIDSQEGPHD